MMLSKKNINSMKQNKPSLIVNDFARIGVVPEFTYNTLLKRGVNKWFFARKKTIALKNALKDKITQSIVDQKVSESGYRKYYLKGYRKAMEECRRELRSICHGPRWVAPPNDPGAKKFLRSLEAKSK